MAALAGEFLGKLLTGPPATAAFPSHTMRQRAPLGPSVSLRHGCSYAGSEWQELEKRIASQQHPGWVDKFHQPSGAFMHEDEFLSTDDVARRLLTSPSTVRWWRHTGYGPPGVRVGRRVLYRSAAVEQWLDGLARNGENR